MLAQSKHKKKYSEGKKRAGKKHQNLNVWHTNLLANIFSLILYTSERVHMLDQLDVLLILHVIYFLYHLHFQYEFHNSECSENYSRNVNILSFKFVAFIFWESERSYRNFWKYCKRCQHDIFHFCFIRNLFN